NWCISRQLWWGHRIPAWYCDTCGETVVSKDEVTVCPVCGGTHLTQDPDTLDTWFSSALWPFSTLGWPENTEDLKHYYPTNTLVTGYDIIGFWVSRMIFSALEYTGKPPFGTVLIHGLVRDAQGRKMSKSLGNGIDPLEIIDKYGADALRFTLATGNSPGNDMRFSDEKVEASRNFANKLWNAARFILMNLENDEIIPINTADLALEDKWIISKYNTLCKDVTDNLEKFELGLAVAKLYDFIWDVFCDWYIEICKSRLNGDDMKQKNTARSVLTFVFGGTLALLHPFMPFITEEIWQSIPHSGETLMMTEFPKFDEKFAFSDEEEEFEKIMAVIKAIRNRRAEMNVPPSKKATVQIQTAFEDTFKQGAPYICRLAYASEVEIGESFDGEGAVRVVTDCATVFMPMKELVDVTAEIERLNKDLQKAMVDKEFFEKKLNNEGFMAKAPENVKEQQRQGLKKALDKIKIIEDSINELKNM
ncbi:MAG: class I tRNA ligase family protein, partial [Clostridia bacterium]|nr:class I tRNA ligase family protein [Clostridia bacterium]